MRRCNRPIQDEAMATLRTPQQAATAVIDNPTLSAGADERVGSYRMVIVGTDGSDSSLRAVDRASVIAAGDGAKLIVATAYFTAEDDTRAQDVLKDVFPQGEAAEVSIKRIQDLVAERFNMSLEELCGDKRSQNIVYPRQVAMYLSRELTDSSLPKIGKEFGGRDHTTVIHATSKIARLIREDRSVYNLVRELTARGRQAR